MSRITGAVKSFRGSVTGNYLNEDPAGAFPPLAALAPNPFVAIGNGTNVAQITTNAAGQVTNVVAVPIAGAPPSGAAGGDLTGFYPAPTLAPVGATTIGPIGDATNVAQVSFDANGRMTAVTSVPIVVAPVPETTLLWVQAPAAIVGGGSLVSFSIIYNQFNWIVSGASDYFFCTKTGHYIISVSLNSLTNATYGVYKNSVFHFAINGYANGVNVSNHSFGGSLYLAANDFVNIFATPGTSIAANSYLTIGFLHE